MAVPKLRFPGFSDEWRTYTLSDILLLIGGNAFSSKDASKSGVKWLKIANVGFGNVTWDVQDYLPLDFKDKYPNYLLDCGDIVLTLTRPILNGNLKIAQVTSKDLPALLNQRVAKLQINEGMVDKKYIFHLLRNRKTVLEIESSISGTDPPNLGNNELKKILITIPLLNESNKIAKFMDTVEKKIQLQQEKIDLLKEQKKGYQLKLLNNKDWKTIRLGDYADIKGRLGWKGLKQEEYVDKGPFLIAGKHIIRGEIQWDKCDMIPFERYEESMEIALENGDVIFSKDGSLGNPAYISNLHDKATINSTMMLVRVQKKEELDSNFVYHILNSHIFRKLIHLKVSGSSIPHLFQADMKEFSFAIPEDVNEQKQIVTIFNLIDKRISLAYEKLDSLKAQKQAFMQQLFI